jgi:predicted cupin superfamily sugar epimerase
MTRLSPAYLVEKFQLQPHPEGGYYAETYRSAEAIQHASLPSRFTGDRSYSTAIYFLLPSGALSALHRIQSDEVWHFYSGDPLELVMISPDGESKTILIGNDPRQGHFFQFVVPAGHWFASRCVVPAGGHSFVGCTVAPGFDFSDFEMAERNKLKDEFPQHSELIDLFTH